MAMDRIIGIDLGTTNSLVAFMQGETPVVIPGDDGLNLLPSVVALDANNQPVIGNAARNSLIETPERAVYSIKRLMGRGVEDIQEELKLFPFRLADDMQPGEVLRIKLGDKTFTPPEISALILRQLKRSAERFFGGPVTKAVITVPAYFNDAQRQATKDAGRIAGLEVLRLVNEPTAASLAYGLERNKTASSRSTTSAAAPSTFPSSSCTTEFSKSSPPMATRISAATTSTTCSSPSRSTTLAATSVWTFAAMPRPCKPSARPSSKPRSRYLPSCRSSSTSNFPAASITAARLPVSSMRS